LPEGERRETWLQLVCCALVRYAGLNLGKAEVGGHSDEAGDLGVVVVDNQTEENTGERLGIYIWTVDDM